MRSLTDYEHLVDEAVAWSADRPYSRLALGRVLRGAGVPAGGKDIDRRAWLGEVLDEIKIMSRKELSRGEANALEEYIAAVIDRPAKELYPQLAWSPSDVGNLARIHIVNPAASSHDFLELEDPTPARPVYVALDAAGDVAGVSPAWQDAVEAAHGAGDPDAPLSVEVVEPGPHENPGAVHRRAEIALAKAGLSDFVDNDPEEWLAVSLEDAHARLLPYLEPLVGQTVGGRKIAAYETPLGTVDALLGQNYKTSKSSPAGEAASLVMGLTLLPADKLHSYRALDPRGRVKLLVEDQLPETTMSTFCAGSNPHCREACLLYTGRNPTDVYNHRRKAALSIALLRDPGAFCRLLVEAIRRHIRYAKHKGLVPYVRLNVLSDIPWELVLGHILAWHGTECQFYDYTKVAGRRTPENYDLTFSYSGTNQQDAARELERGRRVAVVFLAHRRTKTGAWETFKKGAPLPSSFWGLPVVDGDISDLRPLDPQPCIVGLRWKTPAGAEIDPASPGFKFVEPAYLLEGGVGTRQNPSVGADDHDYLVVPVTPRYQEISGR